MNKDDYKALKDKLCFHNPEYDERAKIESLMIKNLQKELQKYERVGKKKHDDTCRYNMW